MSLHRKVGWKETYDQSHALLGLTRDWLHGGCDDAQSQGSGRGEQIRLALLGLRLGKRPDDRLEIL